MLNHSHVSALGGGAICLLSPYFSQGSAWCRWDACFIRLLDGLLQAGALNALDTSLRVPTAIRRLEILNPIPLVPAGSEGGLAIPQGCIPCAALFAGNT